MKGPWVTHLGDRYTNFVADRTSYTTSDGAVKRTPLPYMYREAQLVDAGIPWNPQPDLLNFACIYMLDTSWGRGDNSIEGVQNKALARFMDKVHGDVQGLVNLAEYRQTWGTLAALLAGLRRPATTLDGIIRKYWNANKSGGGTGPAHVLLSDSADIWLAWHFGLEPLIKDLYATAELIQTGPIPKHKVVGSAKGGSSYSAKGSGWNDWSWDEAYQFRCKVGGFVEVTNPNLHLANSLGLLNPAAVVWELMPWSFVLDWMFSFGQWVNSLSDEFGVSITDVYRTTSCHARGVETNTQNQNHPPSGPSYSQKCIGFRLQREIGLPSVNLNVLKTAPWSLTRIFTAAALIMQRIPRAR